VLDIAASGNSIQKVITPALRGFAETHARFAFTRAIPSLPVKEAFVLVYFQQLFFKLNAPCLMPSA
jgi:hypothetical protein